PGGTVGGARGPAPAAGGAPAVVGGAVPGVSSGVRSGIPPLQVAGTGDLRVMHVLLGSRVDPALAGSDVPAVLAVAVSRNDEPGARLLLESGAHPDDGDRSLLEHAVRVGTKDMVELLIAHGADLTVVSREGQPMVPRALAPV